MTTDIQCDKTLPNHKGEIVRCVKSYGHDGDCVPSAADIAWKAYRDNSSR